MLSQHYRGSCSFLFVNGIKVYQFKVKGSEIKPYLFCLRNTSDEFKSITWKKWSLRYVYNFSVDCNTIGIGDVVDIHKYLTEKKHTIIQLIATTFEPTSS